ncbi:hypothetical protein NHX12_025472 [Muraenolepis orangiensis]|uniref:Uncharacterized protein n=1 Tax=Muraenolepis orangiensis TaxID=630683 RepID=A0A9Q0ISB1_9TELE|nr:hypothetical protein NHX12_025472 [Muraenolepis orangiensis]
MLALDPEQDAGPRPGRHRIDVLMPGDVFFFFFLFFFFLRLLLIRADSRAGRFGEGLKCASCKGKVDRYSSPLLWMVDGTVDFVFFVYLLCT